MGSDVGERVGFVVGSGRNVGDLVGFNVGAAVGDRVGLVTGATVGSFVTDGGPNMYEGTYAYDPV